MGNNNGSSKRKSTLKHAFVVGLGTFFFAVLISGNSQLLLNKLSFLPLAFLLLIVIISIGVTFDIIGVAATAADEAPFHARAARRMFGAKQSIWLVRNADKVSSFCSDVVGDICGTVSGAIGAFIVIIISQRFSGLETLTLGTVITGIVAALTVGGKAAGKSSAINEAETIILVVGQILAWFIHLGSRKTINRYRKG